MDPARSHEREFTDSELSGGSPVADHSPQDRQSPPVHIATSDSQSDSGYSLSFGMRSMALFTALAAGLFALIGLLGPLAGTLIGFAVATILFAGVLLTGVVRHSNISAESRRRMNSWLLCLAGITMLLFVASGFAGGGSVAAHFLNRLAVKEQLCRELGFTHESEMNLVGQQVSMQTMRITSVAPGGEFEQAGFLVNDIVVDRSSEDLFAAMEAQSGRKITVEVVSSPPSMIATQLDKLPHRAVTFSVP